MAAGTGSGPMSPPRAPPHCRWPLPPHRGLHRDASLTAETRFPWAPSVLDRMAPRRRGAGLPRARARHRRCPRRARAQAARAAPPARHRRIRRRARLPPGRPAATGGLEEGRAGLGQRLRRLVSRDAQQAQRHELWLDVAHTGLDDPEARLAAAAWVLQADRLGLDYGLRLPGRSPRAMARPAGAAWRPWRYAEKIFQKHGCSASIKRKQLCYCSASGWHEPAPNPCCIAPRCPGHLFLLAVIAWVIAPQTDVLPPWTTALAASLLLWRGWLAWTLRPLPRAWLLRILLVLAVAGHGAHAPHHPGRDAGVTLIVVLLALKTLEAAPSATPWSSFPVLLHDAQQLFLFAVIADRLRHAGGAARPADGLVNAHMPVGRPPLVQSLRTAATMALLGRPSWRRCSCFSRAWRRCGVCWRHLSGRTGPVGQCGWGHRRTGPGRPHRPACAL